MNPPRTHPSLFYWPVSSTMGVTAPAPMGENVTITSVRKRPPLVYRYFRPEYGLAALQTREWKITRISELNDPLDCAPKVIHTDFLGGGADFEERLLREFAGNFGVICYSAKIASPVIWSHYALRHTGIALGFDYSEESWCPFEVNYASARPEIDCREINAMATRDGNEIRDRMIAMGYLTKQRDWAYEEEYRHFIAFDACRMEGTHYFRGVPFANLREVVLGIDCEVSAKDIARILKRGGTSHAVALRQCRRNRDRFDLDVEDVETLPPQSASA